MLNLGRKAYMREFPDTLDDFERLIWERLRRAAVDKKDALQVLTLISIKNGRPDPRSVILRKAHAPERQLIFHSDRRASKVDDIKKGPELAIHGWHPGQRMQLRLYGRAELGTSGDLWEEEWNSLAPTSRLNYSSLSSPGTPIGRPSLGWESYASIDEIEERGGEWKANFAVISFHIEEIEGLILARGNHLRARFGWKTESPSATWLIP